MNLSIKEAAIYLGVTEAYLRRLVRRGRIAATKVPLTEGAQVHKYVIATDTLDAFRSRVRSHRPDGRRAYKIYLTPAELVELAERFDIRRPDGKAV